MCGDCRNWRYAIQDFSDLLKRDPLDAKARLLRGRCHEALDDWNSALADFSGTIHLDPKNAKAFYYRGCLLRKSAALYCSYICTLRLIYCVSGDLHNAKI